MLEKQQKPKFLNLFQIAMPVTAIVSILHRLSGLLLSLFLPVLIYGFYQSVQSKTKFDSIVAYFDSVLFQFILICFVWSLTHHILAGIRYLLIDVDIGVTLASATVTAWFINISSVIVTVFFALALML